MLCSTPHIRAAMASGCCKMRSPRPFVSGKPNTGKLHLCKVASPEAETKKLRGSSLERDRLESLESLESLLAAAPLRVEVEEFQAPVAKRLKYSRIMLKVSGEALQGEQGFGIDPGVIKMLANEVKNAVAHGGIQIAIVVGGGNYFRGADAWPGLERATADYVGMLATVMNALCLQSALESIDVPTRVQTAIEMREVAEPFIRRRAIRHLERGRVVIFGAGTGNPFFTTDTAAALRAAEINAEVFLKATKVDGIYDCDPVKYSDAKRYDKITYRQVSEDNLKVMDETAITLCKENNIPVVVFSIHETGNILRAAKGERVGTIVCCDKMMDSF